MCIGVSIRSSARKLASTPLSRSYPFMPARGYDSLRSRGDADAREEGQLRQRIVGLGRRAVDRLDERRRRSESLVDREAVLDDRVAQLLESRGGLAQLA